MSVLLEQRIVDLELRFTTQQDEIEKLSSVVFTQERELERMRGELRALKEYLSAQPWEGEPMPHEKPPHY